LALYKEASQKHPELVNLSEKVLDDLSTQDIKEHRRESTMDFIMAAILAATAYMLLAVSGAETWRLTGAVAQRCASRNYQAVFQAVLGLQEGSFFFLCGVLAYFIFLPIGRRAIYIFPSRSSVRDADFASWRFGLTAMIVIWAALGWAIVTWASFRPLTISTLNLAFRIWLVPPSIVLLLAPVLGIVIGVQFVIRWKRVKGATTSTKVLRNLLHVLSRWPGAEASATTPLEFRRKTALRLSGIADHIRRLDFGGAPHGKDEEWAARQFALAADNLSVCGSWLYVPQQQSMEAVRSRVIVFCNAFLTGNLYDLPRTEVSESEELISPLRKQRIIRTMFHTVLILIYFVTPFAFFMLLRHKLAALSAPDSLWLLLYSLWLVVGLFAYLEQTSQRPGETLVNLVKIVLGR